MATLSPYPHYRINVIDKSIFEPVFTETLPLFRAVYPMKCEKGPVGIPVWCPTITRARQIFGEGTFDVLNKDYYSSSSEYLKATFTSACGAFIVRLADEDDAETAFAILEAVVKAIDVPQYEKDADGNFVYDSEGDRVQLMSSDEPPVGITETGYSIKWRVRYALITDELFNNLQVRTVTEGSDTVKYYPIASFKASSVGAWGNYTGFRMWSDLEENAVDKVARVSARYFSFAPVVQEALSSTSRVVRDKYNNVFNSFVFKPDTIDTSIAKTVSADEVLEVAYAEGEGLPYEITFYPNIIEALGDALIVVEINRNGDEVGEGSKPWATDELSSAWMVDIFSARDLSGKMYDHIVIDEDGSYMDSAVTHYLDNGDDGDMSDAAIESLYRSFLDLSMNPDIVDKPRYPFTHIVDTGWSIDTKYAICDFLAVRDDVKIILATQRVTDVGGEATLNTAAIDESIGSALRARALLVPESIIKGTECFRAIIFTQAGHIHGLYSGIVPANIWYVMQLSRFHNTTIMKGAPEGLPFSDINVFKSWNWTPSADSMKSRSWDTGLNYFQYYTTTRLHYASLRTVYRYDTSVLTIDDFSNALIYIKHLVRQSWATFAGVTLPAGVLQEQVELDLTARLQPMLNDRYKFSVSVYQTEEERNLGYVHHVLIAIESPANNRVWDVDIECRREGFEG